VHCTGLTVYQQETLYHGTGGKEMRAALAATGETWFPCLDILREDRRRVLSVDELYTVGFRRRLLAKYR
jgi:hypothetical protein